MDNLRRAILVISIVVLIGAGIVGFLLALDNITDKKESPVVTLAPDGEKYDPSKADPDRTFDPAKVIDGSTTVFAVTSKTFLIKVMKMSAKLLKI